MTKKNVVRVNLKLTDVGLKPYPHLKIPYGRIKLKI